MLRLPQTSTGVSDRKTAPLRSCHQDASGKRSSVAERERHTAMLMGHPPQIIARGRENASQGCFEGLTPGQVSMVVQELVACDAEVEKALADTLEAVQKIAQAGPN